METDCCGKGLVVGGLVVAGALIGAALGILYAPKSGKETREDIRHSADGLLKKAKEQYEEATKAIEKVAAREKALLLGGKKKLERAIEDGIDAIR